MITISFKLQKILTLGFMVSSIPLFLLRPQWLSPQGSRGRIGPLLPTDAPLLHRLAYDAGGYPLASLPSNKS